MHVAPLKTPVSGLPDTKLSVRDVFGIDSDMQVPAFSETDEHVPDLDPDYLFDRTTTLAILAGFAFNRRVMITGYHGTGKSTHVEQIAARLIVVDQGRVVAEEGLAALRRGADPLWSLERYYLELVR